MKRLKKEYQNICDSYDAELVDDTYQKWQIALCGPDDSPYFGGTFLIEVNFPDDYPFKAPEIIFSTKIYHPNINHEGKICIAILKDGWAPSCTICKVMEDIKDMLITPNAQDPLVAEIANQYLNNREAYEKKAAEVTSKYAM